MNSRRIELSGTGSAGEAEPPGTTAAGWLRRTRGFLPHLQQQRLGRGAQHGELVNQRRIENGVAVLLIREDVQLLAALHRRPAPDCVRGAALVAASRTIRRTSRESAVLTRLWRSRLSCVRADTYTR